jgi:hypothetical protein
MLEKIKWYFVNYGLVKYLPIGVMAGMTALGTFLAAHAGMLEQWGVTYGTWPLAWTHGNIPSGNVILIELDTTSQAVITLVASIAAMAIRAAQHHATGTPVVPGGNRVGDPPAETPKP